MKTLKLTLICCLLSAFTFASVSQNEKEALLALYNSTNGQSWTNAWDITEPVNSWFGVTLEDDKVVAI